MTAHESALLQAFDVVAAGVAELDTHRSLRVIKVIRQVCDGIEAKAIAGAMETPDDTAAASAAAAAGDRKSSASKRRKTARRGAAVKKNKTLGDKLDSGDITGEQADLLADADKASDGAALADDELVNEVSGASTDQTRDTIKRWLADRRAKADVEAEYQRQRANRRYYTYRDKSDGLMRLCAAGDDATIALFKRRIDAMADAMYQSDGGREVANADHPRTYDQRGFDALERLLIGDDNTHLATGGDGRATPTSGEPRQPATSCGTAESGPGPIPASRRYTPPVRTQAMIMFNADRVFGDPTQRANAPLPELIGHGPISEAFVNRYLAAGTADIVATVLAGKGDPLWQGRRLRNATEGQVRALILRDQCCRLCGADYSRCDAHHLIPFNAPARGPTDVDKMALVCQQCHRWIHDNNLTLFYNPATNRWQTRPATPDETPPRPKPHEPRAP